MIDGCYKCVTSRATMIGWLEKKEKERKKERKGEDDSEDDDEQF